MLTLNALTAADSVLIPMQCEYYALEGLTALMSTIEQIQDSVNPALEIEGLVRTMYDIRNNLSGAVSRQLHEHFGDKLLWHGGPAQTCAWPKHPVMANR